MLKKTITCEDFEGNTYTEDYYFHMSKSELAELDMGKKGGFAKYALALAKEDTNESREEILKIYKDLILNSYGKISPDSHQFIKSPELSKSFMQTNAFDALYMELIQKPGAIEEFFRGLMPKDVQSKVTDEAIKNEMTKLNQ